MDSAVGFIGGWTRPCKASRDEIVRRRALRRSLDAKCLYVRGQIELGRSNRNEAIRAFEESLMVEGRADAAYQLASLATAKAEDSRPGRPRRICVDEASRKIDQAQKLNRYELDDERLAKLEQRLWKLSTTSLSAEVPRGKTKEVAVG